MKLEDQVSSLAPSQCLKELKVKQESFFEWTHHIVGNGMAWDVFLTDPHDSVNEKCSAFTASELGQMLPRGSTTNRGSTADGKNLWMVECPGANIDTFSDTEADARAKMLIYLIENKLVKP